MAATMEEGCVSASAEPREKSAVSTPAVGKNAGEARLGIAFQLDECFREGRLADEPDLRLLKILTVFDVVTSYLLVVLWWLSFFWETSFLGIKWPHLIEPLSQWLLSELREGDPGGDLSVELRDEDFIIHFTPKTKTFLKHQDVPDLTMGHFIGRFVTCVLLTVRWSASGFLMWVTFPTGDARHFGIPTKLKICQSWAIVALSLICIYTVALICSMDMGDDRYPVVFLLEILSRVAIVYKVRDLIRHYEMKLEAAKAVERAKRQVEGEDTDERPGASNPQPSDLSMDGFDIEKF